VVSQTIGNHRRGGISTCSEPCISNYEKPQEGWYLRMYAREGWDLRLYEIRGRGGIRKDKSVVSIDISRDKIF